MNQELLTTTQLQALGQILPNSYTNCGRIQIDISSCRDTILMHHQIWSGSPTSFTLWTTHAPEDFIKEMNIRGTADLEAITLETLWAQYRKGKGEVWADLDYLGGVSMVFSTDGNRTLIRGDEMAYADEQCGVWDQAYFFKAYVREYMPKIYTAVEAGV